MAFGDYMHCRFCVAEVEKARSAGLNLQADHPAWIGYKALYVGDREDDPQAAQVICDRHLAFEARARAIRAVVAAQWGEMVCVACVPPAHDDERRRSSLPEAYSQGVERISSRLATLPTAEQIVEGDV